MHTTTPLITVNDLSLHIGSFAILNNISLNIEQGQFIGLIGPNGAGKSSLLRCIYRFNKPSSGHIKLDKQDIWQLRADRFAQQVAVVLQDIPSQFNLSVYDVVSLGLTPHKSLFSGTTKIDKQLIEQAIYQVGLAKHIKHAFNSLSGGEKQRALIARALVQRPKLLIMDEPTSHLDVKYQIQLMALVKSLGLTVLATFHDLNLAASICDELMVIDKGAIVVSGSPKTVITPKMLSDVFGVRAEVSAHPQSRDNMLPHITYYYGYQSGEQYATEK